MKISELGESLTQQEPMAPTSQCWMHLISIVWVGTERAGRYKWFWFSAGAAP